MNCSINSVVILKVNPSSCPSCSLRPFMWVPVPQAFKTILKSGRTDRSTYIAWLCDLMPDLFVHHWSTVQPTKHRWSLPVSNLEVNAQKSATEYLRQIFGSDSNLNAKSALSTSATNHTRVVFPSLSCWQLSLISRVERYLMTLLSAPFCAIRDAHAEHILSTLDICRYSCTALSWWLRRSDTDRQVATWSSGRTRVCLHMSFVSWPKAERESCFFCRCNCRQRKPPLSLFSCIPPKRT